MIFLRQPADPFDPVDPAWELWTDDHKDTGISIQDARAYGGGFAVNECGDDPDDPTWFAQVGSARSLKQAKAVALRHYESRAK